MVDRQTFNLRAGSSILPAPTRSETRLQPRGSDADPEPMTTLGGSLFLIAVGAILAFAVTVEAEGFDINMIGVILMIVGGVSIVLQIVVMNKMVEGPRRTGNGLSGRDTSYDGDD